MSNSRLDHIGFEIEILQADIKQILQEDPKDLDGLAGRKEKEIERLKKKFMEEYEFDFTKGRAQYYSELSLKRPLTTEEFKKYKELCVKLGFVSDTKGKK